MKLSINENQLGIYIVWIKVSGEWRKLKKKFMKVCKWCDGYDWIFLFNW